MIKNICYSIVAACLAAVTPARAHDSKLTKVAPHSHLSYLQSETTLLMRDAGTLGAKVAVVTRWTVVAPTPVNGNTGTDKDPLANVYKVKVSFYKPILDPREPLEPLPALEGEKVYSLVTLGFQAITNEVELVHFEQKGTAKIIPPDGREIEIKPDVLPIRIARTGTEWNPGWGRDSLINNNVWLIKLSGATEFEFTVRETRAGKHGVTRWGNGNVSEGHDNTPPKNPPD